jgi:hypothetical protein
MPKTPDRIFSSIQPNGSRTTEQPILLITHLEANANRAGNSVSVNTDPQVSVAAGEQQAASIRERAAPQKPPMTATRTGLNNLMVRKRGNNDRQLHGANAGLVADFASKNALPRRYSPTGAQLRIKPFTAQTKSAARKVGR